MGDANSLGSTMDPAQESASLVGPSHATEPQPALTGITELTPEEKEKLHAALLEKKELGLYSDKELIESGTKKILVDQGNANIGIDALTGTPHVKHASGNWLAPSDAEYDKTLATVASQAPETPLAKEEHQEIVKQINQMAAIDEGSGDSHKHMDEVALQRIREGASTMELKNLKQVVAAVDHFASAEAADVNPDVLGHMQAPPIIQGAAYDAAMRAKAKRNEEFMTAQLAREKKDGKA